MITVHLLIQGRVQGVGFRAWVVREAAIRGLAGWVRNRRSGEVETVLCGDDASVRAMAQACHEGPRLARVDRVELASHPHEAWTGFEVRPDV